MLPKTLEMAAVPSHLIPFHIPVNNLQIILQSTLIASPPVGTRPPQNPFESFMSCAAVAPLTYSLSRISLLSTPCPCIPRMFPGE